jgi:hypothetical protein
MMDEDSHMSLVKEEDLEESRQAQAEISPNIGWGWSKQTLTSVDKNINKALANVPMGSRASLMSDIPDLRKFKVKIKEHSFYSR